jgi:phosphoribosyl-ATP pyrophosphohydrolase
VAPTPRRRTPRGWWGSEAADLLYHLVVLLEARGASLADATGVLAARHAAR